ncbi:MAG: flagellar motor switch protein FliN [Ectobacillus sp.]
MTYMMTLLQIALFLGLLGYGAFYMTKKTRKQQLNKQGQNGIIQLKDGLYLNHQTSAFLFEIEGKQVFTVLSHNGVHSLELRETNFHKALESTLEQAGQQQKAGDPS